MTELKLTTSKRIAIGFTGVLLVAGATLYIAKKGINDRRKTELEQYRASEFSLTLHISSCKHVALQPGFHNPFIQAPPLHPETELRAPIALDLLVGCNVIISSDLNQPSF